MAKRRPATPDATYGGLMDPLVFNVAAHSAVQNSLFSAARSGQSQLAGDPRRNIDVECGFPEEGEITLRDYNYMFKREPVAARVVEVMPKECWKTSPWLREGKGEDGDEAKTAFNVEWDELTKKLRGESHFVSDDKEQGNPIWQALQLVDELSGIGNFGVILLGLTDSEVLSDPAPGLNERGEKSGKVKNELVYMRCYDQTHVVIKERERDPTNPRCGDPTMYTIQVSGDPENENIGNAPTDTSIPIDVHWTRVIHVADVYHQATSSRVFAVPRQRPVYNNLLSIRKVSGAGGEFYYNHGSRDLILETHPQLGGRVRFPANMQSQVEQFQTGLQRSLRLAGMSAKTLNPAVSDPTPHIVTQAKLICIKLGIPERIFWGSERGELSSNQDKDSWTGCITGRQGGYCIPGIIVPTVDRLINLGVLPTPVEGYSTGWTDETKLSPLDRATVVAQRMEAMSKYLGGRCYMIMAPIDFLTREMDYSQDDAEKITKTAKDELDEMEPEIPPEETPPTETPPGDQPQPEQSKGKEDEEETEDERPPTRPNA